MATDEAKEYSYNKESAPKKGKVSEFFLHLMGYGGITVQNGLILIWNDPAIFMLSSSFAIFQKRIVDLLGKDGEELLYRIGSLNGKNASLVLIKRYGFDASYLEDFAKGGSLDGWGYLNFMKYPEKGKPVDAVFSRQSAANIAITLALSILIIEKNRNI